MDKNEKFKCEVPGDKWVEEEKAKCELGTTDYEAFRLCKESLKRDVKRRSKFCAG